MVEICPAYLEKDLTFAFLLGRVKTILITGFKILGHGFKMRPGGLNSESSSSS